MEKMDLENSQLERTIWSGLVLGLAFSVEENALLNRNRSTDPLIQSTNTFYIILTRCLGGGDLVYLKNGGAVCVNKWTKICNIYIQNVILYCCDMSHVLKRFCQDQGLFI